MEVVWGGVYFLYFIKYVFTFDLQQWKNEKQSWKPYQLDNAENL